MDRTISFGLMYQSKIFMGKHKDYSDLLTDNGSLDIPANLKIGFTWQPWMYWHSAWISSGFSTAMSMRWATRWKTCLSVRPQAAAVPT